MSNNGLRPIHAVAFDVDGTLYTNANMYLRSFGWALRNWTLVKAFSAARLEIRTRRPISDFYALQAELTANVLGIPKEQAAQKIQERIYTEWEHSLSGIQLVSGLRETIAAFRGKGLKLGVLSDFPISRKLGILGIEGLFDVAVSAETSGYLKPNPDGFLALSQGLGVNPENILYVGNSYKYDVLGAHNSGMMSAHFARKSHPNGCANFTFNSYEKLKNWVLRNS